MLYGDMVLYRLEQSYELLNKIDMYYNKKLEDAKVSANKIEELNIFINKGKLYELMLHYRNQEVDLITLRTNVVKSMTPEELRTNLEKYSTYLRELNSEYEIFDEPGVKLII